MLKEEDFQCYMFQQIDIQFPTDNLKYQGCLEEPKLAILAQCGGGGQLKTTWMDAVWMLCYLTL